MTIAGMNAKTEVREISDDDVAQVIALWHASGISRPWNDPEHDIAFARRNLHSTILVAARDSEILATAMIGEDGHRGWAYYVATRPDCQGQGLGGLIMSAAESWLATRGVWKVQLLVREDNTSVIEFYKHNGYKDTRTTCLQKIIEQPSSE